MIDILAQATSGNTAETIGIVLGAALLTIGGREGVAHIKQKKTNGNGFNKALCDERHRNIDKQQENIKNQVEKIDGKLDKLADGVYSRLNSIQDHLHGGPK